MSEWIDAVMLVEERGEGLHVHMEDEADLGDGHSVDVVVTTDLDREAVRKLRDQCDRVLRECSCPVGFGAQRDPACKRHGASE